MERKNAVIVAFGRSAVAKAIKGSLRYTGCVDFGSQVLKGILAKTPGFDPALAEDLICGCAIPEAEQGLNIGRLLADSSGFPLTTAGQTVNRFCASGLQSIASAANAIMAGQAKCIVAGGLENMSKVQMHRVAIIPDAVSFGSYPDNFDTMGITPSPARATVRPPQRSRPANSGTRSSPSWPNAPKRTRTAPPVSRPSSSTPTSASAPTPPSRASPGSSRSSAWAAA